MQRRIERTLLHLQDVLGDLLQTLSDGIAMNRAKRRDFENQEIESSLGDVRLRRVQEDREASDFYLYFTTCRRSRHNFDQQDISHVLRLGPSNS